MAHQWHPWKASGPNGELSIYTHDDGYQWVDGSVGDLVNKWSASTILEGILGRNWKCVVMDDDVKNDIMLAAYQNLLEERTI